MNINPGQGAGKALVGTGFQNASPPPFQETSWMGVPQPGDLFRCSGRFVFFMMQVVDRQKIFLNKLTLVNA
jgi:hypothetical protein